MASRDLTDLEQAEARRVFEASLTLGRIEISDDIGLGDRPWTSVGFWKYTLHLGADGFQNAIANNCRNTFIHELTHVWQGQNGTFGFGFMVNSVFAQAKSLVTTRGFDAAYQYALGEDWGDYNCEQQAQIVEDWYKNGLNTADARFRYIRDNIRKGKN